MKCKLNEEKGTAHSKPNILCQESAKAWKRVSVRERGEWDGQHGTR